MCERRPTQPMLQAAECNLLVIKGYLYVLASSTRLSSTNTVANKLQNYVSTSIQYTSWFCIMNFMKSFILLIENVKYELKACTYDAHGPAADGMLLHGVVVVTITQTLSRGLLPTSYQTYQPSAP